MKLKEIMTSAGFWNLPKEWWHWEYRTKNWAIAYEYTGTVYENTLI